MLGQELKRLRKKAGLTQEQLANRAKLSRNYISLLERNRQSPTLEVFFRLCTALGVRPSAFVARLERDPR